MILLLDHKSLQFRSFQCFYCIQSFTTSVSNDPIFFLFPAPLSCFHCLLILITFPLNLSYIFLSQTSLILNCRLLQKQFCFNQIFLIPCLHNKEGHANKMNLFILFNPPNVKLDPSTRCNQQSSLRNVPSNQNISYMFFLQSLFFCNTIGCLFLSNDDFVPYLSQKIKVIRRYSLIFLPSVFVCFSLC